MKYQLFRLLEINEGLVLYDYKHSKHITIMWRSSINSNWDNDRLHWANIRTLIEQPTELEWHYSDRTGVSILKKCLYKEFETLEDAQRYIRDYLWIHLL